MSEAEGAKPGRWAPMPRASFYTSIFWFLSDVIPADVQLDAHPCQRTNILSISNCKMKL